MKICKNCGTSNTDESIYCSVCASPLNSETTFNTFKQKKSEWSKSNALTNFFPKRMFEIKQINIGLITILCLQALSYLFYYLAGLTLFTLRNFSYYFSFEIFRFFLRSNFTYSESLCILFLFFDFLIFAIFTIAIIGLIRGHWWGLKWTIIVEILHIINILILMVFNEYSNTIYVLQIILALLIIIYYLNPNVKSYYNK